MAAIVEGIDAASLDPNAKVDPAINDLSINAIVHRTPIPVTPLRELFSVTNQIKFGIGHPMSSQHVHMVTMFMKAARTWEEFVRNLDRVAHKHGGNYELQLDG